MPILIKSTNGQRTCRVVNNNRDDVDMVDKLLEALKELTFTFEVKTEITITDIRKRDQQEKDAKPSQVPDIAQDIVNKLHEIVNPLAEAARPPKEKVNSPKEEFKVPDEVPKPPVKKADPPPKIIKLNEEVFEPLQDIIQPPREVIKPPREVAEPPREVVDSHREFTNQTTGTPKLSNDSAAPPEDIVNPPQEIDSSPPAELSPVRRIKFKLSDLHAIGSEIASDLAIPLGTIKRAICTFSDNNASPPFVYLARDEEVLQAIMNAIDTISESLENSRPQRLPFKVNDLVLAKSVQDQTWYRGRAVDINSVETSVFFIDWGHIEKIDNKRIRLLTQPDVSLSRFAPCAIKCRLIDTPRDIEDRVISMEELFNFKFESFNKQDGCYNVTVVS